VAGLVLPFGTHVNQRDVSLPYAAPQILEAHRLQIVATVDVGSRDSLYLRQAAPGDSLELSQKPEDVHTSETVVDVGTIATGLDQPGLPKDAEVSAGVLDGCVGLLGQLLDRLLPLTEQVEELDAGWTPNRVTDPGKLGIERILELSMRHSASEDWKGLTIYQ
jgi:hypothetical protein